MYQYDNKIKRTRKASNELGYDFRLIVLDDKKGWVEDVTSSSQHPPVSSPVVESIEMRNPSLSR